MVLSASIVFQAPALLRREINYKAFLRGNVSLRRILLANSQAGYRMVAISSVPQMRLYKSVSPAIKQKYTSIEAKDNANSEHEMKNFRTSASDLLFLDFPTRRRIHFPFSWFFLFPFCSRGTNFARTRNEFALGPAPAKLLSLRNTLSSGMSCEKLLPVIRFFVLITLTCIVFFPFLIFWQIFDVSRKKSRNNGNHDHIRILSTFRYISFPSIRL